MANTPLLTTETVQGLKSGAVCDGPVTDPVDVRPDLWSSIACSLHASEASICRWYTAI